MTYAGRFAHILSRGASGFLSTQPPRKHRGGIDPLFRENDVRDYVRASLLDGRIVLPKGWPVLEVESRGRIDYSFVDGGAILATCEVKGPVRKGFFDPKKFGINWTGPKVQTDIRKQVNRANKIPGEHYLAILFPFTEIEVRGGALGTSFDDVIRRLESHVPGSRLDPTEWLETVLTNGCPLTTVVMRVLPAEVPSPQCLV
jgi:hypothetical protein